ncbi:MAG: hypothetical protein N2053_10340, partial [Chitinispirillaceae bacterium]|nr:hypothetical protein [Chitinispirillaceae bacterium]
MQSSDILSEEWYKRASQQLVCYEAMFKLLEEILPLEDIEEIASRVLRQWKYFANVAAWHIVIPHEAIYYVIDGAMGEAKIEEKEEVSEWDNHYLTTSIP